MVTARRIAIALVTGLVLISISSATWAAEESGRLDPRFGVRGKVLTDFSGGSIDVAHALAIQSDGKMVAAGFSGTSGTPYDFGLTRYNSRGRLDREFGVRGKVLTDFRAGYDEAYAVAIQSDGKVVAAGYSNASDGTDFAVARYNRDGTLDTTFNATGKVLTDFGETDTALALAIQPDGKIVAAGQSDASPGTPYVDFALARYNPDGTLDTAFNATGRVLTDFSGSGSSDGVWAVAIQSDGKIVAAGQSDAGGSPDFALARYNPDGTLDTTFNATGRVLTDFSGFGSNDTASALAIQPDGKIVAAGQSEASGIQNFALARYNPDGTLDSTFDATGRVLTDFGESDVAQALAVQSDGKIVAAGYSYGTFDGDAFHYDFALARYNADGTLDTTFNATGRVLTDFSGSGSIDLAYAVALQSNGKIVAAGLSRASFDSPGVFSDFALARYLP